MATARAPSSVAGRFRLSAIAPSTRKASANTSAPSRRTRQASRQAPRKTSSPIAARPKIRRLDGEQAGIARERDLGAPIEPRSVEENGGLRQPGEPGAGAERKLDADLGLAIAGAINFLRRGGGDGRLGAGRQRHRDIDAVAAGQPAGRIEQNGLGRRTRARTWKAHPCRPGLMQDGERGLLAPAREFEPDRPLRAWQPGARLQHRRRPLTPATVTP